MSRLDHDRNLIALVRNGNPDAFDQLYTENVQYSYRWLAVRVDSIEDAEDISQEAFLRIYEKLITSDIELIATFRTYLISVCIRILLEKYRGDRKLGFRKDLTDPDIQEEIAKVGNLDFIFEDNTNFLTEDNLERMNNALENLGEPDRSILIDFYYHKLSLKVTAEKNNLGGISNGAMKKRKFDSMNRLIKLFFGS